MKTKININKKNFRNYAVILIAGIFFGWLFFHNSGATKEAVHEHAGHTEEATVWTCSMHPQIKMDKPGKCPICSMDLIPLETNSSGDGAVSPNAVEMSESAIKLAEIQTMPVRKDYSNKEVYLLGKVKPDERNIAELTARFGGRIEKLFVNFKGQQVSKGGKLATIYSPELVTTQKELLEAMAYKETNPAFYRATRNKLKLWDLTDAQIDGIEKGGEPQTFFDVLSPISGTVTMRHVTVGDYVKEGNALFQVINLKHVWVMFEAYQSDLPWLNIGDQVEFTVQSLPGEKFQGKVTYIDPFLDPKTRVAYVRVEADNPDMELKPEMFTNGIIKPKVSGNQRDLLIPKTSVLWTGKRSVVYVKVPGRKHPTFLYREIVLGPEAGDFYVVKEGLYEGEEVAVNGVFKIDAAAQLEGKKSMMNPEGGVPTTGHDHGNMKGMTSQQGQSMKDAELEHAMFNVSGNCEMCKETIEKAAGGVAGVQFANWDMGSKQIHVSYDDEKTGLQKIHKAIANAGYDTEQEKAPKSAYDNLPPCCQYTRSASGAMNANMVQSEFKVAGNCEMCKQTIEKAVKSLEGVNVANWNMDSKQILVSYNKDKVGLNNIHKAIANAGYDTEKEKASQEAYENLPACCQYTR